MPTARARASAKRRKLLGRTACSAICLPNAEETSNFPAKRRDAEEHAVAGQRHALRRRRSPIAGVSSARRRKTRPEASVTPTAEARASAKRRKLLGRAACSAICLPNAEETSPLDQALPSGLLNTLFLRDAEG
jgi:hypothetical protein